MALVPCPRVGCGCGVRTRRVVGEVGSRRSQAPMFLPSGIHSPASCPVLSISARGFHVRAADSSKRAGERVDNAGSSFLEMWERAQRKRDNDVPQGEVGNAIEEARSDDWERREQEFQKMLQVPAEERDRIQREQIVDRAAAALAAANAFLARYPVTSPQKSPVLPTGTPAVGTRGKPVPISAVDVRPQRLSKQSNDTEGDFHSSPASSSGFNDTPGSDFWSWIPPAKSEIETIARSTPGAPESLLEEDKSFKSSVVPFDEYQERIDTKHLPLVFQSRAMPSLPPLQSLMEIEKEKGEVNEFQLFETVQEDLRMPDVDTQTARAVNENQRNNESPTCGVHQDGSRWWQETGVEVRDNGIVCSWTIVRGTSADGGTEWEEKFWEASDSFDYKELGAEKSGRDSQGRVWHEFWKEAMWQDSNNGMQHIEKKADKWAQDASGGQWHEKWFEHYDASGRAEKWADKWSQIDPETPLEPGHAHSWHERWGETYDGQGGTMKYTDKWAERQEFSGSWTKWGDKWDEHFECDGRGVKQGETWWEGTNGEKWNRTWGEGHNGTGWVHKYGKSSSGEEWDTHEEQDTWYESRPHFGFRECMENSGELQRVGERKKPQF